MIRPCAQFKQVECSCSCVIFDFKRQRSIIASPSFLAAEESIDGAGHVVRKSEINKVAAGAFGDAIFSVGGLKPGIFPARVASAVVARSCVATGSVLVTVMCAISAFVHDRDKRTCSSVTFIVLIASTSERFESTLARRVRVAIVCLAVICRVVSVNSTCRPGRWRADSGVCNRAAPAYAS